MLSGKDLLVARVPQNRYFGAALAAANQTLADTNDREAAIAAAMAIGYVKQFPLRAAGDAPLHVNLDAANEDERANRDACLATMTEVLRTPGVRAGALMPDACPAGPLGTIPVGGIVASEHIHPGMHSADICCSMAISVLPDAEPGALLDAVHAATHFGPGKRKSAVPMPDDLARAIADDPMLDAGAAANHSATQGDCNHFAYVGRLRSDGRTALVTHHGSRSLGALLYKSGMALAERGRRKHSPETLKQNAWIAADTEEGDRYWAALQTVRAWTRANHFAIHDLAAASLGVNVTDRFWNEHNFVFRRPDGLFYHGKGATPAFKGWAADATDLTLVPLNMREPILIVRGRDNPRGLGFAPHGAGRNMSRTQHKRRLGDRAEADVFAEETRGIDARFWCGEIDVSELPSAYKNAAAVREQIERFDLAEVVDEVIPHSSIMAGDWEKNAPWKLKARAKREAKARTEAEAHR